MRFFYMAKCIENEASIQRATLLMPFLIDFKIKIHKGVKFWTRIDISQGHDGANWLIHC